MEYIEIGILIALGIYIAPVLIQLILVTTVLIIGSIAELFEKK